MTQEELAKELDVRRGTIGRYERGEWPIPKKVRLAVKQLIAEKGSRRG